jgi:Fur family transcriptional regulator, ferric uptake regulator
LTSSASLDHFAPLRAQGFRLTPQRYAILQVLDSCGCHLSPSEIYHRAGAIIPNLTEATVYRNLDFLAEQGLVLVAHVGSGRIVYESTAHHHHHLYCRHCGVAVEIAHADLASLYERIQQKTGFHLDSSHVTFFGVCPQCAKEREGLEK